MCVEIYSLYSDPDCQHKEYQHTFLCYKTKRGRPEDDNVLKQTIYLPDGPPNIPPGFLGCKILKATRPVLGKCRACRRAQAAAAQAARARGGSNIANMASGQQVTK